MATGEVSIASFARSPRFPAMAFDTYEEFDTYLRDQRPMLDSRDARERSLMTRDASVSWTGTCATCLCPTLFTVSPQADGENSDRNPAPDWARQTQCSCPYHLSSRQRAMLHLLAASVPAGRARILQFGPPAEVAAYLNEVAGLETGVARLKYPDAMSVDGNSPVIDAPSASFHAVISQDYLQSLYPMEVVLAEILRILVPGGRFVFSTDFLPSARISERIPAHSEAPTSPLSVEMLNSKHRFGWDLLLSLRAAGFASAKACLYWSEELGYRGGMNFLFKAVK